MRTQLFEHFDSLDIGIGVFGERQCWLEALHTEGLVACLGRGRHRTFKVGEEERTSLKFLVTIREGLEGFLRVGHGCC